MSAKQRLFNGLLLLPLLLISGCSSCKPVLYPNEHYKQVGSEQVRAELEEILREAEEQGLDSDDERNRKFGENAIKNTAGTGTQIGVSAVVGGVGIGSVGSAVGSAASGIIDWFIAGKKPDPVFKRYVEARLQEKGYQVIGWK